MTTQIITDNSAERIEVKWDGVRYSIVRHNLVGGAVRVIMLSPVEAWQLAKFILENRQWDKIDGMGILPAPIL